MKKLVVICLALLFVLAGCTKNVEVPSLESLPDGYSLEDAKADGCVVFENGDVTCGQDLWEAFIKAKDAGEAAFIRLAFYYELGDPSSYDVDYYEEIKDDYPVLYIEDLTFNGKSFSIDSFEEGQRIRREYDYLLRFEGQPSSASASYSEYVYYVLVCDKSVTWEQIESGMFSSQFGDAIDHHRVYSDLVFN